MEGPSLVILKEEIAKFRGRRLLACGGSTKQVDCEKFVGHTLTTIGSWGKHFLLTFPSGTLRIHFLMFGSYRVDEPKEGATPRLALRFSSGTLFFYSCSIQVLEESPESIYDWRIDVMDDAWDPRHVQRLVNKQAASQVGDVLLDQTIFAGSGNIIKNEVLYRLALHQETLVAQLTASQRKALVADTRRYALQFYEWKKNFVLRKNWQIYRKRKCPACGSPVTFKKTGRRERVSYFCATCQPPRSLADRRKPA